MHSINKYGVLVYKELLHIPEYVRYFERQTIGAMYKLICSRTWKKSQQETKELGYYGPYFMAIAKDHEEGLMSSFWDDDELAWQLAVTRKAVREARAALVELGLVQVSKLDGTKPVYKYVFGTNLGLKEGFDAQYHEARFQERWLRQVQDYKAQKADDIPFRHQLYRLLDKSKDKIEREQAGEEVMSPFSLAFAAPHGAAPCTSRCSEEDEEPPRDSRPRRRKSDVEEEPYKNKYINDLSSNEDKCGGATETTEVEEEDQDSGEPEWGASDRDAFTLSDFGAYLDEIEAEEAEEAEGAEEVEEDSASLTDLPPPPDLGKEANQTPLWDLNQVDTSAEAQLQGLAQLTVNQYRQRIEGLIKRFGTDKARAALAEVGKSLGIEISPNERYFFAEFFRVWVREFDKEGGTSFGLLIRTWWTMLYRDKGDSAMAKMFRYPQQMYALAKQMNTHSFQEVMAVVDAVRKKEGDQAIEKMKSLGWLKTMVNNNMDLVERYRNMNPGFSRHALIQNLRQIRLERNQETREMLEEMFPGDEKKIQEHFREIIRNDFKGLSPADQRDWRRRLKEAGVWEDWYFEVEGE